MSVINVRHLYWAGWTKPAVDQLLAISDTADAALAAALIPQGIRYAEGSTNIELVKNTDSAGSANDGEIQVKAGTYYLPDGTTRVVTTDKQINTPYEGGVTPRSGTFYIVWGATDASDRFTSLTNLGSAEANGIFPAVYDHLTGTWEAIDDDTVGEVFTPASTDIIFALGNKTSSSGGIDSLTQLVGRYDPPAINSNILREVWRSEDFGDNDLTRVENYIGTDYLYKNGEWSIVSATGTIGSYALQIGNNSGSDGYWGPLCNRTNAIPVEVGKLYKMTVAVRQTAGSGTFYAGLSGFKGDVRNGNGTRVNSDGTSTYGNGDHYFVASAVSLSSTFTRYECYFTRDGVAYDASPAGGVSTPKVLHQDVEYVVPMIIANYSNAAGTFQISYAEIVEVAGADFGTLTEQDTVGQLDIDNYSVGRVSFASNSGNTTLTGSTWVEVETVSITLPSNVTDSVVLIEASITLANVGDGSSAATQQTYVVSHRLLDEDDASVPGSGTARFLAVRANSQSNSALIVGDAIPVTYRVQPANLNAGASNTFKLELNQTIFSSSMYVDDVQMRATLLNRSDDL